MDVTILLKKKKWYSKKHLDSKEIKVRAYEEFFKLFKKSIFSRIINLDFSSNLYTKEEIAKILVENKLAHNIESALEETDNLVRKNIKIEDSLGWTLIGGFDKYETCDNKLAYKPVPLHNPYSGF